MKAARRDLEISQGDYYEHTVRFETSESESIDVSARTYLAQIRPFPRATTAVAQFDVDMEDAADGVVYLSLDNETTTGLIHKSYFWDLQETVAGRPRTILRGEVFIDLEVSRP